jgi:hypothetical protein
MKLAVALALVIAFPSIAGAQYAFQLRPSPYRILGGWEQGATMRTQSLDHVTRAVTPVSDSARAGRVGAQRNGRDGDVTGGIEHRPAPHY